MTEEQREFVWNCLSYRTYAATVTEMIKNAVCSGCESFGFEPCSDFIGTRASAMYFIGTRASAMYTVAVYYKTPKDIFPRKIYIGNEVGPLAETFSVTSEEIMELVALYEL